MRRGLLLLSIAALFATACSGGQPITDPTGPDPVVTTTPAQSPDVIPPSPTSPAPTTDGSAAPAGSSTPPAPDPGVEPASIPADTSDDTQEGRGELVTLTDIRVGRHDAFDRIVFDVGGDGMAGWTVGYVDDPRQQGSGERVSLQGDAVLEVSLSHMGQPDDTGVEAYAGPGRIGGVGGVVTELVHTGTYEGYTQVFVGVTGTRPFRVYDLEGRVVLDVWHAG